MLVMRSNESLQHLEFFFRLREMEAKISTVLTVLSVCSLYQTPTLCVATSEIH